MNEPQWSIACVTATTQTTTATTTTEAALTTTTLNQQTSTTDSDSTTLTDEATTVTGLQTLTGIVITSCLHHTQSLGKCPERDYYSLILLSISAHFYPCIFCILCVVFCVLLFGVKMMIITTYKCLQTCWPTVGESGDFQLFNGCKAYYTLSKQRWDDLGTCCAAEVPPSHYHFAVLYLWCDIAWMTLDLAD